MEIGEAGNQPRNVAACGLNLNRNRDRVLVVLDDKHDRQLAVGGGIQGFPKLAFAGGAIAQGDISDLISRKGHLLKLAIISGSLLSGLGMTCTRNSAFAASRGLQ